MLIVGQHFVAEPPKLRENDMKLHATSNMEETTQSLRLCGTAMDVGEIDIGSKCTCTTWALGIRLMQHTTLHQLLEWPLHVGDHKLSDSHPYVRELDEVIGKVSYTSNVHYQYENKILCLHILAQPELAAIY